MIPTAEEFLKNSKNINYSSLRPPNPLLDIHAFIEADLIEFGQLCASEALRHAAEKANISIKSEYGTDRTTAEEVTCTERGGHGLPDFVQKFSVDKESILNSFPISNIK